MVSDSNTESVLVVEDETDLRELLELHLLREGFRVLTAEDGRRGFEIAASERPDLVVLDWMLPTMSGPEVARLLRGRKDTRSIGILMLTAKGEEGDVVEGLESGADDYVTKPFRPKELISRVKAVLRRRAVEDDREKRHIVVGKLTMDRDRFELLVDSEPVILTRAEFRLLWTLLNHPGRVFTRGELAEEITAGESIILERNVDVHVSAVRKKLGDDGDVIQTVRGIGYRCKD
ncbi:Phosphate regulon transcriptional regulatory protein PhoB [Planctomycetes bacterium Pla163]|jgi:two-component system, OmpR family, phosphate regulon response regulator PhoB|uniref:Phosphate regulon transcriptional regulatory protein PhoB n=1 Tax=Rohdeia mirabilis TaxID=2528008 RepID=A0A518D4J8_9BACT|nr:Phosphate regulon transcriptional regulatory protein PhoB [Planctomycetes bacterium Pla163]